MSHRCSPLAEIPCGALLFAIVLLLSPVLPGCPETETPGDQGVDLPEEGEQPADLEQEEGEQPADLEQEEEFDVAQDLPEDRVDLDLPADREEEAAVDTEGDREDDLLEDPIADLTPQDDLAADTEEPEIDLDTGGDLPPAPVVVTSGHGWYELDNELVRTRAWAEGTFEVGLCHEEPFEMRQIDADQDILCIRSGGVSTCDGPGGRPPLGPGDAASISQQVVTTGREQTCIRTRYEDFPTGEPWVVTVALVWEVCLSPGSREVVVLLGAEGESAGQVLEELYFPFAPPLSPTDTGYAVLPVGHGLLLPVGWLTSSPWWTGTESSNGLGPCGVFQYRPEPYGWVLPMPFFGVVEEDGRALYVENESPPDHGLRIRQVLGAEPRVTPRFRAQLGRFDGGGTRRLVYVPMASADYNDLAGLYRDRVIAGGLHRSLQDKMATRPHLDRLVGGAEISTVTCRYDNKSQPPGEAIQVVNTFAEVADQVEAIASAAEFPITRGLIHVDGWGQRGYDNLHPDVIYPAEGCVPRPHGSSDCGPCEAAGGWSGLGALSDYLNEVDDTHQFLFGLHDNYRDFYLDAQSYGEGEEALLGPGGVLPPPYSAWDGGWQQVLCASRGLGYLERNLDLLAAHGVEPAAYYLDVIVGGAAPDQCYSEEHPMSRADCLQHRAAMLSELEERQIVVSSEMPADWAVPHIDHVYWNYYLRHQNLDLSQDRRNGYKGHNTPIGLPVPLWDLVYHDAVIVPWPWLFGDRGENLLDAWLSAGIAEVSLGQLQSARIRSLLLQQMALHRQLGMQAMTGHHFLDNRFMIQEALFSEGGKTTTDRNDLSVSSSGVAGVEPGPFRPNPWYLVSVSIASWSWEAPNLSVWLQWVTEEDLGDLAPQRVFLHALRDGIEANGDHWPDTPTTEWTPGTPVTTGPGVLAIPRDGSFTLVAGLYDPGGGRLPILGQESYSVELARLEVSGATVSVDDRPYAEARLVMARATGARQVEVMTEWYIGQPMPEGLRVFFHVNDGDTIIENADYQPGLPIHQWPHLARRREARRTLTFEQGEIPGRYTLVTGMYDPVQDQRVDFVGTDAHRRFVLGELVLVASPEGEGVIQAVRFCPGNISGCQ
ncbi:MAG: hypothetical protein JW797_04875 [Bradymonadales bacterium]|nr:hypothetical protein [Bradymonadales bacterium]